MPKETIELRVAGKDHVVLVPGRDTTPPPENGMHRWGLDERCEKCGVSYALVAAGESRICMGML